MDKTRNKRQQKRRAALDKVAQNSSPSFDTWTKLETAVINGQAVNIKPVDDGIDRTLLADIFSI